MIEQHANQPTLYTIGHSNHEWDVFAALLRQHSISAIADVRSSPFSRFNPQFNRELLERQLKVDGLQYVFMGRELGARRDEPECFEGRQARYEKIAKSPMFLDGIRRLQSGVTKHRIALMCAEKDPITCHRMVLVCRVIQAEGVECRHVLEDGSIETNAEAEERLLSLAGLSELDLFRSRDELLADAYEQQGLRIAWVEPEPVGEEGNTP